MLCSITPRSAPAAERGVTPLSLPQLRNLVLCAEAGAVVLPAMPAFYQQPRTIEDLGAFMAGKVLSILGFEHALYPSWKG